MIAEIATEALRYLVRAHLEGLQMHSRYLRNLVDRNAHTLPLRRIHEVDSRSGCVIMQLLEGSVKLRLEASEKRDLEALFHRVNNAFILGLTLSFHRQPLKFLYHLRENADRLQCFVKAIRIRPDPVEIDYALLDFLGGHLKPQIFETTMTGELREDYAILWTHEAWRNSFAHVGYQLYGLAPAPNCVIAKLFRVDVVQTCTITTDIDPRSWIGKFIELFGEAEHGVDIVQSVTLLYMRSGEVFPLRRYVEPFGEMCRTEAPHSDFIKKWKHLMAYKSTITESTDAYLFEFENAKAAKKLEVFVWTIAAVERGMRTALHYAYLLRVVNID